MEHLSNCHGEWNIALSLLYSLPFVGAWFKLTINKTKEVKNVD